MRAEMTTKSNMTTKTCGAITYTRVSTGEQDKHGTSPETQRDACRAKALALGLPIIAEYHDGGISGGFLLSRTEFQAAITDIQAGRADTLICLSISRYSRDVEHQQAVKKAVKAAGGSLVFCDMEFADTPEGDLNFTIQGGFAEYERKVIRERTMKGRKKRAEEGRQMSASRAPLGYHVVLKADVLRGEFPAEMLGRYIIQEGSAVLVREMFAQFASGAATLGSLCRDLNARQVPTARGASVWWPSTIRLILANPVYKGQPEYGRTMNRMDEARLSERHRITGLPIQSARYQSASPEGYSTLLSAPPLVTEDIWDQAQQRIALNRRFQGGNPNRARMLSGRAFLSCGHQAVYQPASVKSGSPAYYHCRVRHHARRLHGLAEETCPAVSCAARVAEEATARAFLSAATSPQSLADAWKAWEERKRVAGHQHGQEPQAGDLRQEKAALDKALADLAADDLIAVQAQMAGMKAGASPDAYAAVFAELAGRRKDLEDRRGQMSRLLIREKNNDEKNAEQLGTTALAGAEGKKIKGKADVFGPQWTIRALEEAALVLSAPDVPGETKRDIIGMVVERVVCRKDGADVHFLPGFGLPPSESSVADGLTNTLHSVKTIYVKGQPGVSGAGSETE
jgi:site-specific DNA recombinase